MTEAELFDGKGRWGGRSIADRIDASGDCWEWIGGTVSTGYGRVSVKGKHQLVHRVVWEALVGPIPDGLQIDHLCRNRICCNPDHLEPVSSLVNSQRGESWAHHYKKTHCVNRHAFTVENTYHPPHRTNSRECRACRAERSRRYGERNRND